jgi:predicted PurR-regulated permease PerM
VLIAAIATMSSMVGFKQKRFLLKTVLFLSVLRLLIPVSVMFSGSLQGLMQSQRDEAVMVLQTTQNEVETLTSREQEQPKGWFDSLKGKLDIESKLQQITQQADRAVHAAVYLLAEFVFLMLLMPLLTLWLLFKLTKALIK